MSLYPGNRVQVQGKERFLAGKEAMSLTFDLSKVPDEVKRYPDDPQKINPVTEVLIWLTMTTTIWEITEENYQRAYVRIAAWERAFGAHLMESGDDGELRPRPITMEDVKAHIGLQTNAFPEISGPEFGVKLYGALREQVYTDIRKDAGSFYAGQEIVWPIEQIESGDTVADDDIDDDEDE